MKKIKIMGVAALAAMLLGLFSCSNGTTTLDDSTSTSGGATGILTGYVMKQATNVIPLAGASVDIAGQQTVTDSNGCYIIKNVVPGTYTGTVKLDGYLGATITATVSAQTAATSSVEYQALTEISGEYSNILTAYAEYLHSISSSGDVSVTYAQSSSSDSAASVDPAADTIAQSYAALTKELASLSCTYGVSVAATSLIPLDATISGTIQLTTSVKGVDISAATYTPGIADITVHAVDAKGFEYAKAESVVDATTKVCSFKLEKLPVKTPITLVVDSFNTTIGTTTYYFSSDSSSLLNYSTGADTLTVTILDENEENGGKLYNVVLYAQPEKIIVTNTNAGEATVNNPLALNTPITFTFDRAMTKLVASFNNSGTNNTVTWSEDKKTATITPLNTYFDQADTTITLSGEGADGCKNFEKITFTVTFDNKIKVVSTNAVKTTGVEPLPLTTALTFTFDRAMARFAPTFDVANAVTITWDADKKVATITPVSGAFKPATSTITLVGEAVDGSVTFSPLSVYTINFDNIIHVTATNAGEDDTAKTPLALTTPLTFTFDRAMVSFDVDVGGYTNANNKVAITWDAARKVATVTPTEAVDGHFASNATQTVTLSNLKAEDGSTYIDAASTVKKAYTVTFNNKVTVTTNLSGLSDKNPLATTDAFTFAFDRVMKDITIADDKATVVKYTWAADYKSVTVTPYAGSWNKAATKVTLSGVAEDGSNVFDVNTWTLVFKTFKVESIELVDSTDRAIVAVSASQYIKISCSDTVKKAVCTVGGKTVTAIIKDKVVYIPFNDTVNTTGSNVAVTYDLTSTEDDNLGVQNVSDTYFAHATYYIASSNLTKTVTVLNETQYAPDTILPTDAVTLTFNAAFAATDVVNAVLNSSTAGTTVATPGLPVTTKFSADFKTLTITPATKLTATTYYLALNIKDKDGMTKFTTDNLDFASSTLAEHDYENKYLAKTSGVKCITITVASGAAINTNADSATTLVADFAKSFNAPLVVEFDKDVTGYKTLLVNAPISSPSPTTYDADAETYKANRYAATATISGKVITITPAGYYAGDVIAYFYDADGNYVTSSATYTPKNNLKERLAALIAAPATITNFALTTDSATINNTGMSLEFKATAKVNSANNSAVTYALYSSYSNQGIYTDWAPTSVFNTESYYQYKMGTKVVASQTANDLTYGPEKFLATGVVDNYYVASDVIEVADKYAPVFVISGGLAVTQATDYATSGKVTGTIPTTDTDIIVEAATTELLAGDAVTATFADTKVTAKVDWNSSYKSFTVHVMLNGGTIAAKDTIVIKFTDANGNAARTSATAENPATAYTITF